MVFATVGGSDDLVRSFYDPKSGLRRQTSLGRRDAGRERLKAEFDEGRREAAERLVAAREGIERQAGINRALGLGRVPILGARILRALDAAGLLGRGRQTFGAANRDGFLVDLIRLIRPGAPRAARSVSRTPTSTPCRSRGRCGTRAPRSSARWRSTSPAFRCA